MKTIFLLTTAAALCIAGSVPDDNGTPEKRAKRPAAAHINATSSAVSPPLVPDPDNGGIKLANGFSALVFADNVGKARHAAIDPTTGTMFVKLARLKDGKGIVQLSDTDGDGRADQTVTFGTYTGTGAGIYNGYL